jgi:hypothetical protein
MLLEAAYLRLRWRSNRGKFEPEMAMSLRV